MKYKVTALLQSFLIANENYNSNVCSHNSSVHAATGTQIKYKYKNRFPCPYLINKYIISFLVFWFDKIQIRPNYLITFLFYDFFLKNDHLTKWHFDLSMHAYIMCDCHEKVQQNDHQFLLFICNRKQYSSYNTSGVLHDITCIVSKYLVKYIFFFYFYIFRCHDCTAIYYVLYGHTAVSQHS